MTPKGILFNKLFFISTAKAQKSNMVFINFICTYLKPEVVEGIAGVTEREPFLAEQTPA